MAERGRPVPSLEKRPDLFPHLTDYWLAFITLDKSRYFGGMGFPQPITINEIKAYAEVNGFGIDELPDLQYYVRELDTIYLKRQAEKAKKEAKRKK